MDVTKANKRIIKPLPMLSICFLLMTGTAFALKVTVDFDRQTDFSKYKTYAFSEGTPTPVTLTNQRIEQAIEAQLVAKGLTRVASNPDLSVVYHCAVDKRTQLNTTSIGDWGWGPGWGRYGGWGGGWLGWGGWGGYGGDAITQVEEIPVGHLIVDIGDAVAKRYIWRGTATDTVSSNPEKNAKTINQAVGKMFEKFPPPEKK
jgi:hypothetical protein